MKRRNGLPKHCSLVIDRHGKRRIRFRQKSFSTYLPYPPSGDDFTKAYDGAALAGVKDRQANIGGDHTQSGSFNALCVAYYRSPEFTGQRKPHKQPIAESLSISENSMAIRLLKT